MFGRAKWDDYTKEKDTPFHPSPTEIVNVPGGDVSAFSKSQLYRFDSGVEVRLGFIVVEHWQLGVGLSLGFFDAF